MTNQVRAYFSLEGYIIAERLSARQLILQCGLKSQLAYVYIIGASAASPVLARSMPALFVCMSSTDRPVGRIAHAQKHAKHML